MNSEKAGEPKFVGKAKLTRAGQLTLPKEARQDLRIDDNSELYWYSLNDVLVLIKTVISPSELAGQINRKRKK